MMTAYTVTFPGQWIAADQFEQALHQASTHTFSQGAGVTFRFLPSCKMMVDAAVRLLSLANQLAAEGSRTRLKSISTPFLVSGVRVSVRKK